LRFGLGALQLVETRERNTGRDAREPLTDERRVHEHAVLSHHIREATIVAVARLDVLFEPDPSVENE
jgi:hypothetical protein